MNDVMTENVKGVEIKFRTRAGVFSKVGLDAGTRLMMENVEVENGTLIADLGAGGGALGIFCAKLNWKGHVHLLEDHLRAVELAKENVALNDLRNAEVFLSDNFSAVGERTYHQILSNPAQHLGNDFLEEVAHECYKHLKPGGQLTWVIQKHVKPFVERLFEKYFKNVKIVAHGKEHVVISAFRR